MRPDRGLAVARQMAHITYLSAESMRRKFGRRLQDGDVPRLGFDVDFQVESYLRHQGESFLRRFDANSYLYLSAGHGLLRAVRRPGGDRGGRERR